MTTTTEKLEQLAAAYEQKAAALRLAAAELNGHATERKQGTSNGQLQAAMALRASQRSEGEPAPRKNLNRRAVTAQLVAILRAAGEPLDIHEIRERLASKGTEASRDGVWQMLTRIPGLRRTGDGTIHRKYGLARSTNHHRPRTRTRKRVPQEPTDRKAATVVGLVRDAGGPVTIKELVPLARAAGIDSLTGMVNYVTQGYLKRTKKRGHRAYAFVAMPSSPSSASPAS